MNLYILSKSKGRIAFQPLDANTETPIGHKLEVSAALLSAGVEVVLKPEGFVIEPGLRCRL